MIIVYKDGTVTINSENDEEKHTFDYVFSDSEGMYPLMKRYINDKGNELNTKNQETLASLINGNSITDVITILQNAKTSGTLK